MHNQKISDGIYKVKYEHDESLDPFKDKRCFQSFMHVLQKTYSSTPDNVNGIFPFFKIILPSMYSPPIIVGSSIV